MRRRSLAAPARRAAATPSTSSRAAEEGGDHEGKGGRHSFEDDVENGAALAEGPAEVATGEQRDVAEVLLG